MAWGADEGEDCVLPWARPVRGGGPPCAEVLVAGAGLRLRCVLRCPAERPVSRVPAAWCSGASWTSTRVGSTWPSRITRMRLRKARCSTSATSGAVTSCIPVGTGARELAALPCHPSRQPRGPFCCCRESGRSAVEPGAAASLSRHCRSCRVNALICLVRVM